MDIYEYVETTGGEKIVRLEGVRAFARENVMSVREAEILFLSSGVVPYRYIGNVRMIGMDAQRRLLEAKVCVVGCGGLGGSLCELLARLGVGRLVLVDPDVFEEHNLNRQLMSREDDLGKAKVDCARRRIQSVNSAIQVETHQVRAGEGNIRELLSGCDLAMDALDNIESRIVLERACIAAGIPMVHGALGNAQMQVTVVDGEAKMAHIYGDSKSGQAAGNPAPSVMACASMQAGEAVKVLAGLGNALTDKMLLANWLYTDFDTIAL